MRVLSILPAIPFPADTGGHLRSLHLLLGLDKAFDVTVLMLERQGADLEGLRRKLRGNLVVVKRDQLLGRGGLSELVNFVRGGPLLYARWAGESLAEEMERQLRAKPFDIIHFDHVHTAQLLPIARRLAPNARVVIDEHNVEARILERVAKLSGYPRRQIMLAQAARLERMESRLVSEADAVLACSSIDGRELTSMGARNVQVVPNGVDFKAFAVEPAPERKDIVFVGSMDWWPNADAAMLLVKEIWPRVESRMPGATLKIVGRNPAPELRKFASATISVTGSVPSVLPFLKNAFASAIPLRAGSGTRLKIIEASAARVPIVCSRLAAEGLPLMHEKHVLYAETPDEFAAALARLWNDRELAKKLADNAYEVAESLDWGRVTGELVESYRRMVGKTEGGETVAS